MRKQFSVALFGIALITMLGLFAPATACASPSEIKIVFQAWDLVHYAYDVDLDTNGVLKIDEIKRQGPTESVIIDHLSIGHFTGTNSYQMSADSKQINIAIGYYYELDGKQIFDPYVQTSYFRTARIKGQPVKDLFNGPMVVDGGDAKQPVVMDVEPFDLPEGCEMVLKNMDFRAKNAAGDNRYQVVINNLGTISFENCIFYGLFLKPSSNTLKGTLIADNCAFHCGTDATSLSVQQYQQVTFQHCYMEGDIDIGGASKATAVGFVDMTDCLVIADEQALYITTGGATIGNSEFYTLPTASEDKVQLNLYGRAGYVFGSLFTTPLQISLGTPDLNTPAPGITGNAFLRGIDIRKQNTVIVIISGNYWGGPSGPGNSTGWLSGYGTSEVYDIPCPTNFLKTFPSGNISTRAEKRPLPEPPIFVREYRIGQNTLSSMQPTLMRQGRDTLICFDIGTLVESLPEAKFFLEWDGQRIEPYVVTGGQPFVARRDYGNLDLNTLSKSTAERTLNFVVLAERTTGPLSHEARLLVDTTGITQYTTEGDARKELSRFTVAFKPAFKKPLHIGVVSLYDAAWESLNWWAPDLALISHTAPGLNDLQEGALSLKSQLKNMLPLEPNEAQLELIPGLLQARVLAPSEINNGLLSWDLESYRWMQNALAAVSGRASYDMIAAVLPTNSINGWLAGDASGVRYKGTRVILFDISKPTTATHELGHCFGLYTRVEQYDLPTGPDGQGNQVFFNIGALVQGVTAFLPSPRLRAVERNSRVNENNRRIVHYPVGDKKDTYDVMGGAETTWIVPSTLNGMYTGLSDWLDEGALPPDPVAVGYQRILMQGALQRGPNAGLLLLPTSVQLIPSSGNPNRIQPGGTLTRSFYAYSSDGKAVIQEQLRYKDYPDRWVRWAQTFDVPTSSVRFEIRDDATGQVIWTRNKAEALMSTEIQPLKVDNAAGTVDITWTPPLAPRQLSIGKASPSTTTSVINYQLLVSTDGQKSWQPIGMPSWTTTRTLPLSTLPGGNLAFKVVTSDGFTNLDTQIASLVLSNQAPKVEIWAPLPGDQIKSGLPVTFIAHITDAEDGPIENARWQSSRDGLIGTNDVVEGINLSEGTHVLTVEAADSQGLKQVASVTVTVGPLTTVDLRIRPEDLNIRPVPADPQSASFNRPQIGQTNRVTLSVRNQGITNTAQLQLFLTTPTSSEILLAQTNFDWQPFELGQISADFLAATAGPYRLRAHLESLGLPDSQPANNDYTWNYTNQTPAAISQMVTVVAGIVNPIQLTGVEPDGNTLAYRIVKPPSHGTLLGVPPFLTYQSSDTTGDEFTFVVSNSAFTSPEATITLHSVPNPCPNGLNVAIQPASTNLPIGGQLEFKAAVINPSGINYQWQFNGVNILGATNVSLQLTNVQPAQAGTYTVMVDNGIVAAQSQAAALMIVASNNDFATWINRFSLPPNARGPADDPDHDGLVNYVEYAFGLDPTIPDREGRPRAGTVIVDGLRYLTLTYRRPVPPPTGPQILVTASPVLSPWQAQATIPVGTPIPQGSYEEITVRHPVPLDSHALGFLKLGIQSGP